MDQDRRIEKLHEEASAEYLQGRFGDALRLWRELQTLDPGHERALEGIRLCEMLSEEAEPSMVFGSDVDAMAPDAGSIPISCEADAGPWVETPPIVGSQLESPAPQAAMGPEPADDDPLAGLDDLLGTDSESFDPAETLESIEAQPVAEETPAEFGALEFSDCGLDSGDDKASPDLALDQLGECLETGDLPPITPDPKILAGSAETVAAPESESEPNARGLGDAAAQELCARVDELLIEATRVYDAGDRDAALSVLARVFILDEEHEGAGSLQAQILDEAIEGEAESDRTAAPEAIGLAPDLLKLASELEKETQSESENVVGDLFDLDAAASASVTDEVSTSSGSELSGEIFDSESASPVLFDPSEGDDGEALSLKPGVSEEEEPGEAVAEDALDDLDLSDEADEPEMQAAPEAAAAFKEEDSEPASTPPSIADETTVEVRTANAAKASWASRVVPNFGGLPSFGNPRTKYIAIGATVALLLAGAWVGYWAFGSSGDDAELDEQVRQARLIGANASADTSKPEVDASDTDVAPVETAPVVTASLEDVLAKAQSAFREEDWSTAVVAFNQALEIDPGNRRAKQGFERASEAYREVRAYEEKLASAMELFDRADYRMALRVFYRLPNAEHDPKFDHYKVQGWFNLGVQALKIQDCSDARSHFAEIESIAPADPDLPAMIELTRTCRARERSDEYYATIEALQFRAIQP